MKPSRAALEKLEGKLVAFSGWETAHRHNNTWVCISRPYVLLWDRDESVQDAVKKKGGYHFDHLWLTGDGRANPAQSLNLYSKVGGVGVVRKYVRKNGTVDFTVKSPSRKSIEEFLDLYNENFEERSQKERLRLLQQALQMIELHQSGSSEVIYGIAKSVSAFKREIAAQELELRRSVAATDRALETATMNGKCKALDLIDLKRRTKAKPKGF